MTKDEALKMAIEALENAQNDLDGQFSCGNCYTDVIQACKEALEQPAQEPAYQVGEIVNPYGSNIKIKQPAQDFFERGKEIAKWADKQNEQPAQEPIAWLQEYENENCDIYYTVTDERIGINDIPVYTHPAPAIVQEPDEWMDKYDEWSDEITQSHPLKTKSYLEYDIARKMVSNRNSKGALVDLVCWLLQKQNPAPSCSCKGKK